MEKHLLELLLWPWLLVRWHHKYLLMLAHFIFFAVCSTVFPLEFWPPKLTFRFSRTRIYRTRANEFEVQFCFDYNGLWGCTVDFWRGLALKFSQKKWNFNHQRLERSLSQAMPQACRVHWSWVDRTGDAVKQRRATSPTCNAFWQQDQKCSDIENVAGLGTSSEFFFSFYSASCLRLGDLVQRCPGQSVEMLAPWPPAGVIPRRRPTAAHFQSVERTVLRRSLEGLANVRLDELTVVRRHWLFFSMLTRRGRGLRERREKILRWRHSKIHCTNYNASRRETAWMFPEIFEVRAGRLSGRFRLTAHRTVQTRPISSRSVHHGIFPDVFFLYPVHCSRTNGAQWHQGESKFLPCFSQLEHNVLSQKVFHGLQKA